MKGMRYAMILLLGVAGLVACTPVTWYKQGGSPALANSDHADCSYAAWREAASMEIMIAGRAAPESRHALPPMESDLTAFCMRAKGYDLIPVSQANGQ